MVGDAPSRSRSSNGHVACAGGFCFSKVLEGARLCVPSFLVLAPSSLQLIHTHLATGFVSFERAWWTEHGSLLGPAEMIEVPYKSDRGRPTRVIEVPFRNDRGRAQVDQSCRAGSSILVGQADRCDWGIGNPAPAQFLVPRTCLATLGVVVPRV